MKRHETGDQTAPTHAVRCLPERLRAARTVSSDASLARCRPGPLNVVRSAGLSRAGVLARDGKIRGPLVWSPDEHEPPLVRSGHHN